MPAMDRFRRYWIAAASLLLCSGLTVTAATTATAATTNTITVSAPSTEQSTVGTAASLTISATDSDTSATLSYSASGLPAGLSIAPSTGTISGTPTGLAKNTVTVTATDGTGATGTASITWQVGGNITIDGGTGFSGAAGEAINIPFIVHDNAPGDILTYSADLPFGVHLDPADSLIVGWSTGDVRVSEVDVDGLDGGSGVARYVFAPGSPNLGTAGPIRLNMDGKCLDDPGDSTAAAIPTVQIWTCNGDAAQKWSYASDGSLQINSRCLYVATPIAGTSANEQPYLKPCDSADPGQQWDVDTGGQLRNRGSGFCLTDPASSTVNGTRVDITGCGGYSLRQWTLPETIHSAIAGRCLDDYRSSTANGAEIDDSTCSGTAAQNWIFEPNGTIQVSGKCLDDTNDSSTSGTKIQLWTCNGDAAQKWTVTETSNSLGLELQHGSMCMSPTAMTAANGAQVVLESCGTDKTYWRSW